MSPSTYCHFKSSYLTLKRVLTTLLCIFSWLIAAHGIAQEVDWQQIRDEIKPTVVNLEIRNQVGLGHDRSGGGVGSAFVVDAERGWIVTNQHVSGQSRISRLDVTFFNGESTQGKLLYYDPWHDFSIIQIDTSVLSFPLQAAVLGSIDNLREGDEVMIIGNSALEGFSTRIGLVSSLFREMAVNPLGRHSHQIHVAVGIAGGNSGGPLYDERGEVVAISSATNRENTESFHLRIGYVVKALEQLRAGNVPVRGDLYISLHMLTLKDVERYLKYPKDKIAIIRNQYPTLKKLPAIDRVIPETVASQYLRNDDLLVSIQGKDEAEPVLIGEDVFRFDQIIDANIGSSVKLITFRNGKEREVELVVADAEEHKPYRYALFGEATFHNMTPEMCLELDMPLRGVFMSEVTPSTAFDPIGFKVPGTDKNKFVVVYEIDGQQIGDLEDFMEVAANLETGQPILLWACDAYSFGERSQCQFVDLVLNYPLVSFQWNPETLDWEEESL